MNYIKIGKITKPHGLHGELKIFSTTDFASERYKKDHVVFYLANKEYISLIVNSFYKQGIFDVVSFKDYLDINLINNLLGKELFIKEEDATIPKDTYRFFDLINCEIIENNKVVAKVTQVMDYPANVCLICKSNNGKEFQIPFVDAFIKNVDIKNKQIKVELIQGML